jgi:hypothetical protein
MTATRPFSDETLEELVQSDLDDPAVILFVLTEAAARGSFAQADIDNQLKNFLFLSLERLQVEYEKVFSDFWDAPETARAEFRQYLLDFVTQEEGGPAAVPPWPWPISEPPVGKGDSGSLDFPNRFSGLWLCGYRVGKTDGLPEDERRHFLDYFFRNPLPPIIAKLHGSSYGLCGSEERLKKIADVLAANCRNFRRNNRTRYAAAISDYETDLEYLKQTYYKAGSFPWPPVEP